MLATLAMIFDSKKLMFVGISPALPTKVKPINYKLF